jgi:glycosyltransferase involved in cell wall biosynthesis
MGTPKISILVPTYNPVPEHLREALTCIKKQTEQDWHVVIHDDASTVDVRAIVKPFLADPRFSFVRSDRRLGLGGNWNACLKFVNAPVIQYLFQDDLWEPAFLERGLKILEEHPSLGFVAIDHDYRTEGNPTNASYYGNLRTFKHFAITPGFHRGEEFLRFWLANDLRPGLVGEPSFVMLRRSLIEKTGPFLTDMPQSLDNEFWIRCLQVSDIAILQEHLGTFRVHPAGASAVHDQEGSGLTDRLRIYQILLKTLPRESTLYAETKASLARAFSAMVKRFFRRRAEGKSVAMRGGSRKTLLTFAMRHPFLILGALVKARAS